MNRSPINAIAINGSAMVYGSAVVTMALSGALSANVYVHPAMSADLEASASLISHAVPAAMGEATASIEVASAMTGSLHLRPVLVADVSLSAANDPYVTPAVFGEAEPKVELDGSLWGRMIVHPALIGEINVASSLLPHTVHGAQGAGLGRLQFLSHLEPYIIEAPYGSGIARLRVASRLQGVKARSLRPRMDSSLWLNATGRSMQRHQSPSGEATLRFAAKGAGRLGDKHHGEGVIRLQLAARLTPSLWRQVHGSGQATIGVSAWSQTGFPPIPNEFHPARPDWRFQAPYDPWRLVVPKEQRRLVA